MKPNPYIRLNRLIDKQRQCEQAVHNLVGRFLYVADKIRSWKTAGFQGNVYGIEFAEPQRKRLVNVNEAPTLQEIALARLEWMVACDEVLREWDILTRQQQGYVIDDYAADISDAVQLRFRGSP